MWIKSLFPLFLLVFLIAFGGCRKPVSDWEIDQIQSGSASYSSAKVFNKKSESNPTLRLEFLRMGEEVDVYLITTGTPFAQDKALPSYTPLEIETPSHGKKRFLAERFLGGEKLKIPRDYEKILIESLSHNQPVTLVTPGYRATFSPKGFKETLDKMLRFSFFDLPITIGF